MVENLQLEQRYQVILTIERDILRQAQTIKENMETLVIKVQNENAGFIHSCGFEYTTD